MFFSKGTHISEWQMRKMTVCRPYPIRDMPFLRISEVISLYINPDLDKPIFIQIAEQLEDSIFTKVFPEETKIPSTNEISALLNINPHTVLKGMNLLVDEEIIYKKRGLGMFVKEGAVERIRRKRQSLFYSQYVEALVREALKLKMSREEIMMLIERGYENECDPD